ncbi:hypothetical protein ACVU7I_08545 [Patulibacter sp. S7RM1-6]
MRFLHPAAALLTVGALALAGCGGSDGDEAASTTPATADDAPATTATQAAPTTPTVETTVTTTPTTTQTVPATTTATEQSGGTTPPSAEDEGDGQTASGGTAPSAETGGDQPTITVNGTTARAIADDPSVAEIWCDNARGGSYAQQLADATVLQITLRGTDDVQRCELPR